jgi:hypothetical protein
MAKGALNCRRDRKASNTKAPARLVSRERHGDSGHIFSTTATLRP